MMSRNTASLSEDQLQDDHCREAISLMMYTTDQQVVLLKMRDTFEYRQKLVHDQQNSDTILKVFPRFLDVKGLSCSSLENHLMEMQNNHQPYLLVSGMTKADIHSFFIAMDKTLIPCQATPTLAAFDKLFKSHFVFSVKYDESLCSMFTFVQTTVYNIDMGKTRESPKIRELRAKVLNKC
ncbi:hypothetical protein SKAU_G00158980 [Synaphobranchus kaupii]|uniref:Uncharacterized protein n=1 Tax=Synaphobranchus kaupii TaxID=118154 RepID=A0A9Q1IZ75_SYNKA|nr:hypothetical protein SKAU_G00158980 [Synaphobranchus kaupii]